MKDIIGWIAKQLVDHPEEVSVSSVEGNNTTVFELRVAKEDVVRVIDQEGRPAAAMRTILPDISYRLGKHAVLQILTVHDTKIGYRAPADNLFAMDGAHP